MNRKINKNFLIIGAMILATVLAFLLISIFSKNDPRINPGGVVSESALKEEILQLESNLLELELVFSEKDLQVENFETLLDEKYVQLDQMDKKVDALESKIDQLEREGKVDKATIAEMREKLANAKGEMVKNLKGEINLLVRDLGSLTRAGDSLALVSQELEQSIKECQENANAVAGTTTSPAPSIDTNIPATPVADTRSAGLYATSINVRALRRNGKNAFKRGGVDAGNAYALYLDFTLEGVEPVSTGDHLFYVVIKNKVKGIVTNARDNSQSGNTININGVATQFSAVATANYQGSKQIVIPEYKIGDDPTNLTGSNQIYIYWKNPQGKIVDISRNATGKSLFVNK